MQGGRALREITLEMSEMSGPHMKQGAEGMFVQQLERSGAESRDSGGESAASG